MTLWKHAAINGVVPDEIGEPLMGVAIQSFRRADVAGRQRYLGGPVATTDDRGVYRIANLPPGDYLVAAWSRQIAAPLSVARNARDPRFTFSAGEELEVSAVSACAQSEERRDRRGPGRRCASRRSP